MNDHPTDAEYVKEILRRNTDKTFVQRILYPHLYPELPLGNGFFGTHMMASGDINGQPAAWPTIMYQMGLLTDYGMDEGREMARRRGEYITFPNMPAADWFSRNYKAVWPEKKR